MFEQLGVIGCGLMGGSFALALKRHGLVKRVVGYSKSAASTELARKLGVIDDTVESALAAATGSDLVLLAVPVAATEVSLKAIRHLVEPGVLVMDVGSTKRDVVDVARRVLRERMPSFVPAHPIAGKEAAGIRHADAALFTGQQVILTPLPQTLPELVERASTLWRAIGADVHQMSPERHDAAFAAVSHLPHMLAFAFFNAIASQAEGPEFLALAGPGFRDFTRIAASDSSVWRDILMSNREEILGQSQRFRLALDAFDAALRTGNTEAVERMIRTAAHGRSHWHMGLARKAARQLP